MLAFALRLLLKLIAFKTTIGFLRKLDKNREGNAKNELSEIDLKMYRSMIWLSYKFWPFINCLSTSLAFWFVLQRRGINTELRFGVLKDGDKLRSHAWLEHDNNVLSPDDGAVEKYNTFHKAIL